MSRPSFWPLERYFCLVECQLARLRLLGWASSIAEVWLLLGRRAAAGGAGPQLRSRGCLLQGEAGAGVHHWRPPGVDGRDDLLGVDPLQVGAGR